MIRCEWVNPFLTEVHTWPNKNKHNSLNIVIFSNYLKRDCHAHHEQQISVIYFPYALILITFDFNKKPRSRAIFEKRLKKVCNSNEHEQ